MRTRRLENKGSSLKVKKKRGEAENYRPVSVASILGNKFEMILMDELNDTFGEVQFNRSESAWIYQRQSCQEKFLPFHVEAIIGFCKREPMENCQGLQSVGLFIK